MSDIAWIYFVEFDNSTYLGARVLKTKNCYLRRIQKPVFNLKELRDSAIDPKIESPQDMWGNFGRQPTVNSQKSETKSIYELLQECHNCSTPQPVAIRECIECGETLPFCQICKRGYSTRDKTTRCSKCSNMFHYIHIFAWVQSHGSCAMCKQHLTLNDL